MQSGKVCLIAYILIFLLKKIFENNISFNKFNFVDKTKYKLIWGEIILKINYPY
jgi:hypothetical protein